MTIKAILNGRTGPVHSAAPGESVASVAARLTEYRIGAVPVIDNALVVGIFSERDVIRCITTHGAAGLDAQVADVMTSPAICVESQVTILSALSLMTRRRIRHLPVMDGGTLTGFVSIGDLVKHRIEAIEAEASAMRDYIAGS